MTLIKIVNDGIKKVSSNGGRIQEIIYKNENKEKYRIYILSESYDNQSYARLSKWSEKEGWETITTKNPKRDFNIDISYSDQYQSNAFEPIIKSFEKLIKEF